MALANYTLASVTGTTPVLSPTDSAPLRVGLEDLLYSPEQAEYLPHPGNEPYNPPVNQQRRSKLRKRAGAAYLPPPHQFTQYPHEDVPHNPYNAQLHTQVYHNNPRLGVIDNQRVQSLNSPYDNTGQYIHDPTGDYDYEQKRLIQNTGQRPSYSGFAEGPYPSVTTPPSSRKYDINSNQNVNNFNYVNRVTQAPVQPPPRTQDKTSVNTGGASGGGSVQPLDRPRGFTKVEPGGSGSKTQLHAVIDYDEEGDYYDDVPGPDASRPAITPLQGPILLRNGSVPVVPLTSYPTVNNGSFYQIPILWTALSLALGYELQGQIVRGVPCVKKNYQLYCPTAGNKYPLEKIESFIDENKALIKRMYGSFTTPGGSRVRRSPLESDIPDGGRRVRQSSASQLPDTQPGNSTGRVDACESKTEIMTPYWALNSARKLRAIVNTMHFEQAIHQEVCSKTSTNRCSGDCGCEQKYKWHRLLAYDPNDDCAGIFMDWFLFPSCCVCRCNP